MCQHVLAANPQDRERRGAFRVAFATASGGPLRATDVVRVVPHRTLAVICDGLSGHRGHRVASQLAASTIVDTVLGAESARGIPLMEHAIASADRVVSGASMVRGEAPMGTSFVGAFPHGEQVIVGAVGSAHATLVSHAGDQIGVTHTALTSPHSLIGSSTAHPSVAAIRPRKDQVLVLSSGGLEPLIEDGTLGVMTMWHYRRGDLVNLAKHLVDAAVHRRSADDSRAVSVVIAGLLNAAPREGLYSKRGLSLVSSAQS